MKLAAANQTLILAADERSGAEPGAPGRGSRLVTGGVQWPTGGSVLKRLTIVTSPDTAVLVQADYSPNDGGLDGSASEVPLQRAQLPAVLSISARTGLVQTPRSPSAAARLYARTQRGFDETPVRLLDVLA